MPCSFQDRVDRRGVNVIRVWLDEQPLKARLKIDQILRNLSVADRLGPPFVKKIAGYVGLFEIVAKAGGVQYRPLGGYGPRQGEFTLVLGAIEHNDNIRPPDAFATSAGHVAAVANGTAQVCNHDYEQPRPESA